MLGKKMMAFIEMITLFQGLEIRTCYLYPLLAHHATKNNLKGEAYGVEGEGLKSHTLSPLGLAEDLRFMTELQLSPDDVV